MTNVSTGSERPFEIALEHLKRFNRMIMIVQALSVIGASKKLGFISIESVAIPVLGGAKIKGDVAFSFAILLVVFMVSLVMHGYFTRFKEVIGLCNQEAKKVISLYPSYFTQHIITFWVVFVIMFIAIAISFPRESNIMLIVFWCISSCTLGGICGLIRGELDRLRRKG